MNNFFYEYRNGKVFRVDLEKGEQIPIKGKKLSSFLKEGKVFSKQEVYFIIEQLLMILDKMRSVYPPIVHKNINPSTIIIKKNWELAIIAYNLETIRTTSYTAPEIMDLATPKSDLYSVGILFKKIMNKPNQNLEKFISYMIADKPEYRFKDIKIALNLLKKIKHNTISDTDWPLISKIDTNNSNYENSLHNEFDSNLINLESIKYKNASKYYRVKNNNNNILVWLLSVFIFMILPLYINDFFDDECDKAPMGYYNDEDCNLHQKSATEVKREIMERNRKEKKLKEKWKKTGLTGKR